VERILVTEEQIQGRVAELGRDISRDYAGRDFVLLGILKGAAVFLADLTRAISIPHTFDFIGVASYKDDGSQGRVVINKEPSVDLHGKHVLLVEDIYDSGLTLSATLDLLRPLGPASVEICVFLSKDRPRAAEVAVRYVGFRIPNAFVVGYGLDLGERYRNLRYVGVANPDFSQPDQLDPSGVQC